MREKAAVKLINVETRNAGLPIPIHMIDGTVRSRHSPLNCFFAVCYSMVLPFLVGNLMGFITQTITPYSGQNDL